MLCRRINEHKVQKFERHIWQGSWRDKWRQFEMVFVVFRVV